MALPAGLTAMGYFKGDKGDKGDTGVLAFIDAISVAADQPAVARMVTDARGTGAEIEIPRGLSGTNGDTADAAVATYFAATDSATYAAAAGNFVRADELVINADRYPSVQAALDVAPAGATVFFPASMSPIAVPAGGFVLKSNNLTMDAMAVEFQVADWGTPAFLALRANNAADGHTFRIGMVRYTGVRGDHTGATLRGSAPYCSGCGVWSNGDRNFVQYLRTVGMPTPIFFSSWDGVSANDRIGIGNRIGYLEAEGYDFGLLFVRQEGYDWGDAYCHDDIDDSGGANPTHAIYGSAAAGFRAGTGTIGKWLTRDHTGGAPYQVKYSDNITADRLVGERTAGVLSVQNSDGFTANLVSGIALAPAVAGGRLVEFVGADYCRRVHVGQMIVDKAQNTDSESVILLVNDACDIGSISITSRHSPAANTAGAEVSVRGVGSGRIGSVQVATTGPGMIPIRLGAGTDAGRAAGWTIPNVRSIGAGAAFDAIPVQELTYCHSNVWGDGGSSLTGAAPAAGIFRRGMRWSNSAPTVGQARGWVQTVNGALSGSTWAASVAVAAGAWVKLANGRVIRYLSAGETGATEPNPTTIGELGNDGTTSWQYMSATAGTVVSEGNL